MRKNSVRDFEAVNLGHGLQPGGAFTPLTEERDGPGGGAGEEGQKGASWAGKMVAKLQPDH